MKHDEMQICDHRCRRLFIPELLLKYGLWSLHCYKRPPEMILLDLNPYQGCPKRYFLHYSISHLYQGRGHLWTENGLDQEVFPGDLIVIPPNVANRYGGTLGQPFIEDTITFTGQLADMLRDAGIIRPCVYHIGTFRRLVPIQECLNDPSIQIQLRGNLLLQTLLMDLYMEEQSKTTKHDFLGTITQCIKEHPERWWSVQDLADLCKLSKEQMRRIFLQQTGLSPKLYIDHLKLQMAGEKLRSGNKSIAEVAADFGYRDPYHFSRRFKAVMSASPKQFRK